MQLVATYQMVDLCTRGEKSNIIRFYLQQGFYMYNLAQPRLGFWPPRLLAHSADVDF